LRQVVNLSSVDIASSGTGHRYGSSNTPAFWRSTAAIPARRSTADRPPTGHQRRCPLRSMTVLSQFEVLQTDSSGRHSRRLGARLTLRQNLAPDEMSSWTVRRSVVRQSTVEMHLFYVRDSIGIASELVGVNGSSRVVRSELSRCGRWPISYRQIAMMRESF
jgi:hypothetical protein